jgi:uncharacterized protein
MTTMPDPSESPAAPLDIVVADNPGESRYEARVGDRIVGIAEYELADDHGPIVFVHTEVVPEVEGHGVGSRLAKAALDDVRARGLHLVADCPFITAYLKRHHDWDDLIVAAP